MDGDKVLTKIHFPFNPDVREYSYIHVADMSDTIGFYFMQNYALLT
jgi:hypothetical protein